jgi:hypothetical protein
LLLRLQSHQTCLELSSAGHAKEVVQLASVARAPTLLASLSRDGEVRTWDVASGACTSASASQACSLVRCESLCAIWPRLIWSASSQMPSARGASMPPCASMHAAQRSWLHVQSNTRWRSDPLPAETAICTCHSLLRAAGSAPRRQLHRNRQPSWRPALLDSATQLRACGRHSCRCQPGRQQHGRQHSWPQWDGRQRPGGAEPAARVPAIAHGRQRPQRHCRPHGKACHHGLPLHSLMPAGHVMPVQIASVCMITFSSDNRCLCSCSSARSAWLRGLQMGACASGIGNSRRLSPAGRQVRIRILASTAPAADALKPSSVDIKELIKLVSHLSCRPRIRQPAVGSTPRLMACTSAWCALLTLV